jgi:hypothetical protein
MKPVWSVGAVIGCMATVAIAAQTPSTPQNQGASSDQRITVVGCLQPAPPTPTGTTGSTGATGDSAGGEKKFVLTNVAPPSNDTAGASSAAAKTYQLIANESALSPHVGKKVELTGTIDGQDARSSSPTAGDSSATTNAPKLKVEAGRVMAATCAQ